MRRLMAVFIIAASAAAAADLPGRVVFGFAAGGVHDANDHERWGGGGVGYEATRWLVAPVAQWGYGYASGDVPAWEMEGYHGRHPSEVKHTTNTFVLAGRVRVPLWRMKLRPYGGAGVAWTRYNRQVLDGYSVLLENESTGSGYVALAGVDFFPDPARGFSLALDYRYGATTQQWLRAPGGKSAAEDEFGLAEQLITISVKAYAF
jgi:opacity protein-like surface antigen